ncbi:MAG: hypothetical protein ACLFNN_02090 [Candidatus Paceibacterota bacterium]
MLEIIVLLTLYIIIIGLGLKVISLSISLIRTMNGQESPFVRSKRSTAELLGEIIELDPQSRVFELGAGDGRILRTLHSKEPRAEYLGVEKHRWPALLFKWRKKIEKRNTIQLKQADLFEVELIDATHVIIYLLVKETERLLPKLQGELPAGSLVYSIDFPFPEEQMKPESIHRSAVGQKVYVYRF